MATPSRRTGSFWIGALAISTAIASIYRAPILEELEAFKLLVFAAEIASVGLLLIICRHGQLQNVLALILGLLVLAKFIGGAYIAQIKFDQPLAQSFQEARFGLTLFSIPFWYYLFQELPDRLLLRYAALYLLLLMAIDGTALSLLSQEGLLSLGERMDSRLVCSAVSPLMAMVTVGVRRHVANSHHVTLPLLGCLLIFLHSWLVTTSRIEVALSLGAMGLLTSLHFRGARWILAAIAAAFALALLLGGGQSSNDGDVAGRDFPLAFQIALDGLPFGYGLVTDTVAKSVLQIPETLFFSDYGMLLYVLRLGVVGAIMATTLLAVWTYFYFGISHLQGCIFIAVPILLYLSLIPLFDYGALNGAALLAAMISLVHQSHQSTQSSAAQ